MKSAELRQAFLDFFRSKGHEVVASSPLVPGNDPTLLFTNAGMVQFKDCFLGREQRSYTRAASVQRCVRAGGKHNDLENVGYTARHHTFFEMLGNFSFGDYFKREAIHYAWEFLTQTLQLPREKLWVTVYKDDDEAAAIWVNEIGVPAERVTRLGEKSNFWSMGDTGPCGPCTEIFYDHGPEVWGGPPGTPEEDGDRYIEIWNLVFMQFDRSADGTMTPLPKPSVDTGMGLERLAAVMQHVHSNYDIDLFQNLIKAVAALAGSKDLSNPSLKVIADHIRSCAFLVTDGVVPSNEGRGYVLRRIIRRAIRHGHKLGLRQPFFHKLVAPLVKEMGAAYPELAKAEAQVTRILNQEEERFAETLDQGMHLLEEAIAGLSGHVLPGSTIFKLYDTYGFPVDLTGDIARERNLELDMDGFDREMEAQRERARAASTFGAAYGHKLEIAGKTEFTGYERISDQAKVIALYKGSDAVQQLAAGEQGMVILDHTPFYAESGGQVGDKGLLSSAGAMFEVQDTQKQGEAFGHIGVVRQGSLKVGDSVDAAVDFAARAATAAHHSATHLLHAALRQVLGEHVQQKGSLVTPERLRFDFSHFESVSREQLRRIEQLVNEQIRGNNEVLTRIMGIEDAMASGAMALFGEKYGDKVRVLSMGEFSTELCGGTHVSRTGDIGLFKIVSEGGVAAGVRRIEAVAGRRALEWVDSIEDSLEAVAAAVKGSRDVVADKVRQMIERQRKLEKELEQLKAKLASSQGSDLAGQAVEVAGIKVLAANLEGVDPKALRDTLDQLKNKLGSAAIVLAAVQGDKISLVAGVTKDLTDRLQAGKLLQEVAQQVGGKGGGRADMAQGGGTEPAKLPAALAAVSGWVAREMGA
ncbi:alanine--tRNA ligase [Sulfurivermis fontis]|uniref:alanine--tRNA ligase n=1 Tax=Sulfurivermis fontis TaxID=1972068 RepID=UPI000FDB1C35|nr:alanine--tRNA ligase [Sulfurivermis fontis]